MSNPFHSFSGKTNEPIIEKDRREEPAGTSETHHPQETIPETSTMQTNTSNAVDVIILEDDSDDEGTQVKKTVETAKELEDTVSMSPGMESDGEEEPISLSELSSSFQKCLDSIDQDGKNSSKVEEGFPNTIQVKPFDYEAARRQVRFEDEDGKGKPGTVGDGDDSLKLFKGSSGAKNRSTKVQGQGGDVADEFRQGRRRLAFPTSGNRSATFH